MADPTLWFLEAEREDTIVAFDKDDEEWEENEEWEKEEEGGEEEWEEEEEDEDEWDEEWEEEWEDDELYGDEDELRRRRGGHEEWD